MRKTKYLAPVVEVVIILLLISVFGAVTDYEFSNGDHVRIQIDAPSEYETTIAYGRSFKVCGTLSGMIPDDATVTVSLKDESGTEVRSASASRKGTAYVNDEWYDGEWYYTVSGAAFSDAIKYTAPELVVEDNDCPEASGHNATIKCVYTDETFYALIVSATDVEHGSVLDDSFHFTDADGNPYTALPEGGYTVCVTIQNAKGELLAESEKAIRIGSSDGVSVFRFGSGESYDRIVAFCHENGYRCQMDLLPGIYGETFDMGSPVLSWASEYAEYSASKIVVFNYNLVTSSTAYRWEMGAFLQDQKLLEQPDRVIVYCYDIGESSVNGVEGNLVRVDLDDRVTVCRVDTVSEAAQTGVYVTTGEQVLATDTDASDGYQVQAGTRFAVMGVITPYLLDDGDIVPDEEVSYAYCYLNGCATWEYTFTAENETVTFRQDNCLARVSEPLRDGTSDLSSLARTELEFYHVFETDRLTSGTDYVVTMQGYDRNGKLIEGLTTSYTIHVE